MKEILGFNEVSVAGESNPLKPGAYLLKITNVVDVPEKEYLEVYVDITSGEYANYFGNIEKSTGNNYGKSIRSYKTNALPFFKAFITAVEKSNSGYAWNWNEKTLIGKQVVGVYGEEEYLDKENNVKVNVKLQDFRSVQALNEGKIKVPELKKLKEDVGVTPQAIAIDGNDLPF